MGSCENLTSGSSHSEVAKLSLSVSPITPLAYLLCGIPAHVGDFPELVAWYQDDEDPLTVPIKSMERNQWQGPECGHRFSASPLRMSIMLGHPVCPTCEPRQYNIAFNLGCEALGIPSDKASFLTMSLKKIFFSISFWFNEHHSAGQPQITAKGISKAHKNKNQLKIAVDLQDGRTVFLLVHKFASAVLERFGVIDEETISCAITESNSQKKRQREKQQHAQGNTAPSIMIPGIAKPKLLQGYPVTSSFEKFMNRTLHELTSLAVIINARGVLPGNHELDAWIPDLGIAFEWDAGGDATHPPERREYKDRLANDMGITVYHVNPTKRYPMQFIVANVRRVVRAAEKRLAKRLLDEK